MRRMFLLNWPWVVEQVDKHANICRSREGNDFELQVVGRDDRHESPWESSNNKKFCYCSRFSKFKSLFSTPTMLELATSDARCPLNLSAWKIAFRSQSDQYIQSPKRVMLKGCLSISGEERTILQKNIEEESLASSPHENRKQTFSPQKKSSDPTKAQWEWCRGQAKDYPSWPLAKLVYWAHQSPS